MAAACPGTAARGVEDNAGIRDFWEILSHVELLLKPINWYIWFGGARKLAGDVTQEQTHVCQGAPTVVVRLQWTGTSLPG